eukprot:2237565-Rhodomonas_salina.3
MKARGERAGREEDLDELGGDGVGVAVALLQNVAHQHATAIRPDHVLHTALHVASFTDASCRTTARNRRQIPASRYNLYRKLVFDFGVPSGQLEQSHSGARGVLFWIWQRPAPWQRARRSPRPPVSRAGKSAEPEHHTCQ